MVTIYFVNKYVRILIGLMQDRENRIYIKKIYQSLIYFSYKKQNHLLISKKYLITKLKMKTLLYSKNLHETFLNVITLVVKRTLFFFFKDDLLLFKINKLRNGINLVKLLKLKKSTRDSKMLGRRNEFLKNV